MPKTPVRFLRFMPPIVRDFERAVYVNEATNLAIVSEKFDIPLRLLKDFQTLPSRAKDADFTDRVLAGLDQLVKEGACRQSLILREYLQRKAISHINRKTRHLRRSAMLTASINERGLSIGHVM